MKVLSLFLPEIRELLDLRDFRALRRLLTEINPVDLADGFADFNPQEQAAMFRLLPRHKAALLFEELDTPEQEALLNHIREVDIQQLLTDLDPSDTSQLARELPPKMVSRLLGMLKKENAGQVQRLLAFPAESVGGLMRTRFVTLRPQWSARQALEEIQLRTRMRQVEETFLEQLYVVDDAGRLLGVVALKLLIVAPRSMRTEELMRKVSLQLRPGMDREEAANLFRKYGLPSAPVLDEAGALLGVVLLREVLEVLDQETQEDFAKMVGTRTEEFSLRSAFGAVRVRLPWLLATCAGQLAVSAIVRAHEGTLSKLLALATFMPFIAAMGGNVGTQSATVIVRGLATGELQEGDLAAAIGREVRVGAVLGTFYGVVVGLIAFALYGARFGFPFSAVVSSGMAVSIGVASSMGALWPFVLRRFGFDPATATGPLITTTTDLVSTTTYLTLASAFLYKGWI